MKKLALIAALLFAPASFAQIVVTSTAGGGVSLGTPGPTGPAGAPGPNCSVSSAPGTCDLGANTLLAGGVTATTVTPHNLGPHIYADNYASLTAAVAAASVNGSDVVLTCGTTYSVAPTFTIPAGVKIGAPCAGVKASGIKTYPTTIAATGSLTLGPVWGISLDHVNVSVPDGSTITMNGIQSSYFDASFTCGLGLINSTTATTTAGSKDIVVASATGIAIGQDVTSALVAATYVVLGGTTVQAISGTTITMSLPAVTSQTGLSVSFSKPCLTFAGVAGSNFSQNNMPKLVVYTSSGSGLQFVGKTDSPTAFATENIFGHVIINLQPPSNTPGGNTLSFGANTDSNVFQWISSYDGPASYGQGIVINNSADPTVDADANFEQLGYVDDTGGVQGAQIAVNEAKGNSGTIGITNISGGLHFNTTTVESRQNWFQQYWLRPFSDGRYWGVAVDLNTIYASGTYSSHIFTNRPISTSGEQFICRVDAAQGQNDTLTTQECVDITAGSANVNRKFRRTSSGTDTWTAWQEQPRLSGTFTVGHFITVDSSGNQVDGGTPCKSDGTNCATPPGVPATLCRITAPLTNTGSTSRTQIYNCSIPAGTVSATGTLELRVGGSGCTAAGVPYASCTAANTGTCQALAFLGATITAQTFGVTPNGLATTAAKGYYIRSTIQMQNATASEAANGGETAGSSSLGFVSAAGTIDMTATSDLNVFLTNSVSGDICGADQIWLTYTP